MADTSTLAGILAASKPKPKSAYSTTSGQTIDTQIAAQNALANPARVQVAAPAVTQVQDGVSAPNAPVGTTTPTNFADVAAQKIASGRPEFNLTKWNPSQTPAERAAALVAAKYSGKTAALSNQKQTLTSNLNSGVATQKAYGQIGDAKLAEIYSNLTGTAKDVADKTSALYAGAKNEIGTAYADANNVMTKNADAARANVNSEAASLGLTDAVVAANAPLNQAVIDATKHLATDQATSISNIVTLGANMGAAALQNVNIAATLGANTRKDLVNTVQATITQLQKDHDDKVAEIAAQMADLESSRQADLLSATSQLEADDYDRQSQYEMARIKFESDAYTQDLQEKHANLQDTLALIKSENDTLDSQSGREIAANAQKLQQQVFDQNVTVDERNWRIQAAQQGLDEKQFVESQKQNQFNQWLQTNNMQLDYKKLSEQQKQNVMDNYYKQKQLDQNVAGEAAATDRNNADIAARKEIAQMGIDSDAARIKAANETEITKAAIAKLPKTATPEEIAKAKADLAKTNAQTALYVAQTEAAKAKAGTTKTATKGVVAMEDFINKGNNGKPALGPVNSNLVRSVIKEVTTSSAVNKSAKVDPYYAAVQLAYQKAAAGLNGNDLTVGSGGDPDPKVLQAIAIYFGKA